MQGIGKPQFVLGAGAAERVARVAFCLLPVSYTHLDVYKRQLLIPHDA